MQRSAFIISIFFFIATISIGFGQGPKQQDSVKKLLKTLSRRDPARVDALIYLGKYYADNRTEHLNEALAIAENINYLGAQVEALSNFGSAVESEAKPDYSRSREYYLRALPIAERTGNDSIIYTVCGQIFNACIYLGDYPKALEISIKQLAMAEKTNKVKMMASQYNNIGFLYSNQNNYSKAKIYLVKYVELAEKVGDEGMQANAYNNMAEIHEKEKDYVAALEKLFKALKLYETINDRKRKKDPTSNHMQQYIALTYNNIANLYSSSGDNRTALKYSLKCLEAASKVSINKYDLSFFYITNGNLCTAIGEYGKARASLEKGLEIAQEIDHKEDKKLAFLGLSQMFAAKGDYEKAAFNHENYTMVKNELLNERSSKQMTEMNTKYESEKKDKELIQKDLEISAQLSEAKQKRILRNVFIAGFILLTFLSLFILRESTRKKKANELISTQKVIIEHKTKETTDSIHYAKRIQRALLAGNAILSRNLHDHFVIYKPKDIVSGDFYWAYETPQKFFLCIADSTGHGVPGAFMSLLNISFLNEAVIEKKLTDPDVILNSVRQSLITKLSSDGNEGSKDGMDCVLCVFDKKSNKMKYSAANNKIYFVRDNKLMTSETDKMPVGRSLLQEKIFTLNTFELQDGDMFYVLTDGFTDQFGGPKGKKFRTKQMEEVLLKYHNRSMLEQSELVNGILNQWKGDLEQVDDILLIGIKFKTS